MSAKSPRSENPPEKLQSSKAWRAWETRFAASGDAREVEGPLSDAVGLLLAEAFRKIVEPSLPVPAVLLAIDAFARRRLFPYSDVDIAVIVDAEQVTPALEGPISELVRELWNAGLRIHHSVRTLAGSLDPSGSGAENALLLLDRRLLAGDEALSRALDAKLEGFVERYRPKMTESLIEAARARHARFGNTIHHPQPDVKDAPGGVLDLQLAEALSRLHTQIQTPLERIPESAAFLASVSCFLHYRAGRGHHVLDREAQQAIAGVSYAPAGTAQEWMRHYFRHARAISNEARRALEACESAGAGLRASFLDRRTQLSNADFTVLRDRVLLRNPAAAADAALVLDLFTFVARHGVEPAADTERRLESVRDAFAAQAAGAGIPWPKLRELLALPHASLALRSMERTGLLTAWLPEWSGIEGLIDTDPAWPYTVDEQTLRSIECLERLRQAGDPSSQRFATVLSEIDDAGLLLCAVLLHQTGKADGGADPRRRSAEMARQAAARWRMSPDATATMEFLAEHQSDLADVLGARDVKNPATARRLAAAVGSIERLKFLCVLTWADIAASGDAAANPWRVEQLWTAYQATRQELTRELETDRIQEAPAELPGAAEFIKGFPTRYLRLPPEIIASHVRLYDASRATGVAVQLDRIEGAYRLTIVARDTPAVFASFAAALSSFGLDILKAEAFANAGGMILDTFVFADPKRTLELNPDEVDRLQDLIRRVALRKTDAQRLLRNRAAPEGKRPAPPQVVFDTEASDNATLVEIEAEDRPGLLYRLAQVFTSADCNIDVVLVDTKGRRAIDVFYVASEGRKLTPELQVILKAKLIEAC